MAVTASYQVEVNGLLMGDGTPYNWVSVEGLDLPPLRTNDLDKATLDGAFFGRPLKSKRVVTLTFEITADTDANLTTRIGNFRTAWLPASTMVNMEFRLSGTANRYVTGYPSRCKWTLDAKSSMSRIVEAVAEFTCPDPRIFASGGSTEVLY